eukprot:8052714-Pyramimonas_sp.AAC.1
MRAIVVLCRKTDVGMGGGCRSHFDWSEVASASPPPVLGGHRLMLAMKGTPQWQPPALAGCAHLQRYDGLP